MTVESVDGSQSVRVLETVTQPTFWPIQPDNICTPEEHSARNAVNATLEASREIFYRSGNLSSPQEALEEAAKLLFAHVSSIDAGGSGIENHILDALPSPADSLRRFTAESFRRALPESTSFELRESDFELKLRPTDDRLASELVDCFTQNASKECFTSLRAAGQLDILNEAFCRFLANSFVDEKELGQYLTPIEVVRTMVALGLDSIADDALEAMYSPDPDQRPGTILDPSCGVGSFLAETLRVLYAEAKKRMPTNSLNEWATSVLKHNITGIDKSERMIRLATANLALFGAPSTNLHLANSLVRVGTDGSLCESLVGQAALILTNPPFGAKFQGADLRGYRIAQGDSRHLRQSVASEILYLERYLEWLAPGGTLVSIVPDSVLTNRGLFSELRAAIADTAELLSVVSLPVSTFGAAGTTTKTSILHLRKRNGEPSPSAYFAVCQNVGYDVVTRGSQRRRVSKNGGQLPQILGEATHRAAPIIGQWVRLDHNIDRWDATYHAGLPDDMSQTIEKLRNRGVRVRDVASLSTERWNPRKSTDTEFKYVEIADVNQKTAAVSYRTVQRDDAPSRARKVVRAGDVLVSTVRPERRTVGVADPELDGAICSTGFAVLRPEAIDSYVLAKLLQTDLANAQIVRHATGIAYPAVDEHCIADVILPIGTEQLGGLASCAVKVAKAKNRLLVAEAAFASQVAHATTQWLEK